MNKRGTSKKSNILEYLDIDVYKESKNRIKYCLSIFDDFWVGFSGGKDSLVLLHLVKEVMDELGYTNKIKVCFYDEELIPDNVIAFVQEYSKKDWIDMKYFAVPLKSHYYVLGKTVEYIQWDPNRKGNYVREKPENAITYDDGEIYSQYTLAQKMLTFCKPGKIAVFLGLRADESLTRYMGLTIKRNKENYISTNSSVRYAVVKPIFDWNQKDIFKYFYDKNIRYCSAYDDQHINGDSYRVATPIHAEAAKRFNKLRTRCPILYQQIVNIFPEMLLQERYWLQYSATASTCKYEKSLEGLKEYIKNEITDPNQQLLAYQRYYEVIAAKRMKALKDKNNVHDGYSIEYLFDMFTSGAYKRNIRGTPE